MITCPRPILTLPAGFQPGIEVINRVADFAKIEKGRRLTIEPGVSSTQSDVVRGLWGS